MKHGAGLGAASEMDYESMARRFLEGAKKHTALECRRPMGDLVRFDPTTDEFGVLSASGEIRTFFRPVAGVTHKQPSNLAYYEKQCERRL